MEKVTVKLFGINITLVNTNKTSMIIRILVLLFCFQILSAEDKVTPIPLDISFDTKKALLGKKLFFDTRLSKDNSLSCASCHQLPGGGADALALSFGVDGAVGTMNSPSVLNSVFNFVQFWDGRADTLEDQALGPIENPLEMANTIQNVVKMAEDDPFYKKEFSIIYTDGVNAKNILNAIAEFERALTTPNSKFDKYLRGDKKALNSQEIRGWKRFNDLGCISCHNGVNIGANMYQKSGIIVAIKDKESLGRYNITKRDVDKFVFKVPSLRNIELTAPYFHNGSTDTLENAIYKMGYYQLGISIDGEDIQDIQAFLKTLTGQTPKILQKDF